MLESYVLARERFLKPGGLMFPTTGSIVLGPLSDEVLYNEQLSTYHKVLLCMAHVSRILSCSFNFCTDFDIKFWIVACIVRTHDSRDTILWARFNKSSETETGKINFWNTTSFYGVDLSPAMEHAHAEYFSQAVVGKKANTHPFACTNWIFAP